MRIAGLGQKTLQDSRQLKMDSPAYPFCAYIYPYHAQAAACMNGGGGTHAFFVILGIHTLPTDFQAAVALCGNTENGISQSMQPETAAFPFSPAGGR